MIYKCIFCGKKVEEDAIKANGFCDECNIAQKYADEISTIIRHSQGLLPFRAFKKNGVEIILDEKEQKRIYKAIQEKWIHSILYGD